MKRCPFCDELIRANAIKCKHCGSMLTESSSDTTIIEAFSERYEILEEVGRGGMATVYKARQRRPNRIVALKVIPRQFTHDAEFIARFHREADSAANLYHPHIISIHDEGEIGGYPYMAMRYLSGGTLQEKIRREGPLSEKEIKRIIFAVLDALSYAHEQGIVHRDIKSSNIMLDSKGRPVLMDFGIAKSVEGTKLTRTGTVIGTPEYMSPEQAQGEGEIDQRSDIYSLGVVLYEMATGQVPFRGETAVSVLHKVIHEQPARPRELNGQISEDLENVILRALSKSEGERYQSCEQMAAALKKGEVVRLVVPPADSEKTVKVVQRVEEERVESKQEQQRPSHAGLKAAIAVVSAILLVVVILLMTTGQDRGRGQRQSEQAVTPAKGTDQVENQQRSTAIDAQKPPETVDDSGGERRRIAELLAKAREHFAADRLTSPAGGNALEVVHEVLRMEPGHAEASRLLIEIAERYEGWGDAQAAAGEYQRAMEYYQKSLSVRPNNGAVESKLAQARGQLQSRQQSVILMQEEKTVEDKRDQARDQAQSGQRLGIEWVHVPGGSFQMGDQFGDGDSDERPVHEVTLAGFSLSATEVTNEQYCAFLNARGNQTEGGATWLDVNSEYCLIDRQGESFVPRSGYANHPVVKVTWYGARAFCEWAGGRLPTEAEWEYAARGGGKKIKYPCGNSISHDDANYDGTGGRDSWSRTSPVRSFAPNSLGLYDMAGNVWEWCSDWFGSYSSSSQRNPQGPSSGSYRVIRGGSWRSSPGGLRCSDRSNGAADDAGRSIGFRLCKTG